jgi:aminopeptidase N
MPLEHRLHARCGCGSSGVAAHASAARPFALPSSTHHFERDRPFVIEHLSVDVTLDVAARSVHATATLDVRRVDSTAEAIALDAIGFDVKSVSLDGQKAPFLYDGRVLAIECDPARSRVRVTIVYDAMPRRGLYFLAPDEHYPARPRQVWSQCQEEDARHWIPCHDSPHVKMTTELVAHVPNGWYALSNGALLSTARPAEGAWSFHWKMTEPLPSYLITLAAGEFAETNDEVAVGDHTVPLAYLVPKGREGDVPRTFGNTPAMIRHFSEVTGVAYPWNKYAQIVVSDFIFGGMENTTATTMYEHILLDERAAIDISSDDLVAHELAHQWFGDYVTCRAWYEGWLNEGFATLFEHVWREKLLGADEYAYGLKSDLDGYLAEAHGRYRRPIVCQDYDAPLDLFDRHLYEKGALVLHALRAEVGDAVFWRAIRAYLTAHANGVVETRDLQRAMEEASGKSLGRFFEQWVYKAGHPELEVELSWEKGILTVATKQTQAATDGVPACFELTLDLDIGSADGADSAHVADVTRRGLRITERQQSFALAAKVRPSFVVLDPESRIVGEVRARVPGDMLRSQLSSAKTARGRWLAAIALASIDDAPTLAALARSLEDEGEFWGTRAECAAALGKQRTAAGFEALRRAIKTVQPKVRRAIVQSIGQYRTAEAMDAVKPLALRDASYLVEAEAARSLGKTRQAAALDVLVDLLDRASWFDVVRAGAIDGLAALRDDRAIAHVSARVRYGHSPRTRRAAIMSLPKLGSDRKTRETLELLLEDGDPLLRVDVVRALGELGDSKARPALRERLESDLDPRVRRRIREVLRDLTEPRRAADPLRDEFDKLKAEHTELKLRLAKLEARTEEPTSSKGGSAAPPAPTKKAPVPKRSAGKGGDSRKSGRIGRAK